MNGPVGFFSKREQTPIESRDYGRTYLVLSGLLFLGTMWAVVDEVMTRRPWKEYQSEYYELSLRRWRERYAEAISNFDSSAYKDLETQEKDARAGLHSPEYLSAAAEIQNIDNELLDANRDFTFAKSRSDEAYYFWKKSIHEGNEDLGWKEKVLRFEKQMKEFNVRVENLESKKAMLSAIVNRYSQAVKAIRSKIKDLRAPIEKDSTKILQVKSASILIRQVIMNNFDRSNFGTPKGRVDRCQTCHAGWNDEVMEGEDIPTQFRKHPLPELLDLHNPENFGCTPCHQGQGPALTKGSAHGDEDKYWEWPLLRGNEVYASCNKCHSNEHHVKYAQPLNRAKTILVESGCFGCHEIKGYLDIPKIGPELNQLPAKTRPDWLFRWVRNPKDYNPHTRMPNFRLSDDEAEAVTAYLWNVGQQNSYRPMQGFGKGGAVERGRFIVDAVGCKGCHVIGDDTRMREARGLGYDAAPELTRVGSKVDPEWLFEWLKNPRHYRPSTRMPNLRLTDQEARDAVAFLMSLRDVRRFEEKNLNLGSQELIKRGGKLIREYGCHGCHTIQGMEKEGRVSVALSNIGRKRVDELDFGDTQIPKTWDAWIFNKVKDARVFATDRIFSKMPVFAFGDSEVVLLRTLLRSFTKEEPNPVYQKPFDSRQQAMEAGRRLTLHYNCINCHQIEDTGGYVVATLKDEGMAPPLLRPEGAKVQEQWLHEFLKNPTAVRPWLEIRMPTFSLTEGEIDTVMKYFLALHDRELELRDYKAFQPQPAYVSAGKKLFDDFQCLSCHYTGTIPEGKKSADLAPDLTLTRGRLKPEWILDWIADPEAIQPGTRMPTYFPDMQSPDSVIFAGNAREQIRALRDYVLTLGK